MRKLRRVMRALPSPWLSLAIFGGWLLLNESLAAGQVVLAAIVAVATPWLLAPLRPPSVRLHNGPALAMLILRVGRDVVVSALQVGAGVLRARRRPPRSAFVLVPLELRGTHALAALSIITTVVPGTVWAELAPDHSALLMHVFDLDDEGEFIAKFKRDYEQPLRKIFE